MNKNVKKLLTLALAGVMAVGSVIGAGAAEVLTDKDMVEVVLPENNLTLPQYGFGGSLNLLAKCPECGKSCYQVPYVINGCTINTYFCKDHFQVNPVFVENKPTDLPQYGFGGSLNLLAKCPECGKPCYQVPYVINGCVINAYFCIDHFQVNPEFVENKPCDKFTYKIHIRNTYGGKITLNSDEAIHWGDSRTVTITPNYGYICTGVYVNGRSYGVTDTVELKSIRSNYVIYATFKAVDTKRMNQITVATEGKGSVVGVLNGKKFGDINSAAIRYGDKLSLSFVTPGKNYSVEKVIINGTDMGKITGYTLEKLYYDVDIKVSFKWNNPFKDVDSHLEAVEFVYENEIMESPNPRYFPNQFLGKNRMTLRFLCVYLAELADTEDVLNTTAERQKWAEENGLIAEGAKITAYVSMKETADIVEKFVRVLEEKNEITFTALKDVSGGKEIGKAIGFLTDKTYDNTKTTRYDVAEICYKISKLLAE